MNRINIYEETNGSDESGYVGWFDLDSAEKITEYDKGDPYRYGKILLATAKGKLVVNEWNNSGMNNYSFAENENEIAEILSEGGYDEDDNKLLEILKKFEI